MELGARSVSETGSVRLALCSRKRRVRQCLVGALWLVGLVTLLTPLLLAVPLVSRLLADGELVSATDLLREALRSISLPDLLSLLAHVRQRRLPGHPLTAALRINASEHRCTDSVTALHCDPASQGGGTHRSQR